MRDDDRRGSTDDYQQKNDTNDKQIGTMVMKAIQELESQLAIANKIIATLEEELILYKQKYRDEVDNNEYKMKYRELLDSHWDQKMKQKSMTELNYDGNEYRGRYGEDEENGV